MVAEGATVVDAGQVGSEMLYYLVGSRELDGGLMCTASHNPKAYTGAKLVKQGAIALSGDAGIQDVRRRDRGRPRRSPRAAARVEEVEIYEEFQAAALKFIDPGDVKPLRVVVDGGNGMAGPMVGPLLEQLGLDLVTAYWTPDGEFPDHEPNPLLPENREFIMRKVVEEGADLGIAWDGDADRCFFIDDEGAFVDGDFLTALLAESLLRKSPGEAILYDVRASRAVADTVERGRRHGAPQPRRPRVLQDAHARRGRDVRRRGLRPLLLPRLLLRRQRHDPGAADPRAAERRGRASCPSCSTATARRTSSPARSTPRSTTPPAKIAEIEERYADAQIGHLDGVSVDYDDWHFNVRTSNTEPLLRLCLESLVSRGGHGAPPRRGPGDHPLVSDAADALARAADAGIHCLPIPTPFQVGRVNTYLIEDDPLTLLDSGPNSGTALDALERALAEHGHRVEDLELIVISHQHMDHLGLVSILARRSGAEVAALDLLAPWAARYDDGMEADDAFANSVMTEHGIPEDIRLALLAVSQSYRNWGAAGDRHAPARGRLASSSCATARCASCTAPATRRRTRSSTTPSAGSCSAPTTSSSTSPPTRSSRGRSTRRWTPTRRPSARTRSSRYLESLRATRAMEDVDLILPGHGEPVADHVALIDERFRMHDAPRRQDRAA